jgi:hypothetical protein
MRMIKLIGGPFDGAEGPCELDGETPVWIHVDPMRRARNGLLISIRWLLCAARYDRADEAGAVYVHQAIPQQPADRDLKVAA